MKIFDIAFKDLTRSFRSAFAVGMMFVAPLLITGLIYFAFGGLSSGSGGFSIQPVKVVIANLDQPAAGGFSVGSIIVTAMNDPEFGQWFSVTTAPDEASARSSVDRREAGVAVIIPADFSQTALSPAGKSSIVIVQDPTLSIGPSILRDVISQIVDGVAGTKLAIGAVSDQFQSIGQTLSEAQIQAIAMQYSQWSQQLGQALSEGKATALTLRAPQGDAKQASSSGFGAVLLAGVMAGQMIFFAFYTGAYAAQSILREDEEGTLPRLFTTPTSRATILGGKFVGVFILGIVQAIVLMVASAVAFNINWGQPLSAAIMMLAMIITAAGFGIFLMSLLKNARQSGMVLGGALTAAGMLGGLFTVAVPMPDAFKIINLFTPQGWVLRAWDVTLKGGNFSDVLPLALVVIAIGAAFFALGVRRFQHRYA
ncbi:MAG TPA: ABC transporter permease [Anaerolineae bacterium]|nr:ABC transporter permease [Anaerolineae bacterium]